MTGFRVEERQARGGVASLSDAEVETLAEPLRTHGWHTYLNSANVLLTTSLKQGFDEQVFSDKSADTTGERLSAVRALLEAHDEPVFAWVQLMELHIPYGPMADACEAEAMAAAALCPAALYDIGDALNYGHIDFHALAAEEQLACGEAIHSGQSCAARRLDVELDAFLDSLPPATLVLVTTDHGEGWLDPEADHNWTLSQKLSRSFRAVFDAEHEPASYAVASQVDLPPTVLSRLGLQGPTEQYEGVALGEPRTPPPDRLALRYQHRCGGVGALGGRLPGPPARPPPRAHPIVALQHGRGPGRRRGPRGDWRTPAGHADQSGCNFRPHRGPLRGRLGLVTLSPPSPTTRGEARWPRPPWDREPPSCRPRGSGLHHR